jgi:hypothetical protein
MRSWSELPRKRTTLWKSWSEPIRPKSKHFQVLERLRSQLEQQMRFRDVSRVYEVKREGLGMWEERAFVLTANETEDWKDELELVCAAKDCVDELDTKLVTAAESELLVADKGEEGSELPAEEVVLELGAPEGTTLLRDDWLVELNAADGKALLPVELEIEFVCAADGAADCVDELELPTALETELDAAAELIELLTLERVVDAAAIFVELDDDVP